MKPSIQSRVHWAEYAAMEGASITRLKVLQHSPQKFRYNLAHPKTSRPLTLGTAAHCATLEPERFEIDFAVWTKRTAADAMAQRKGPEWEAFCAANAGKTILTPDEMRLAMAMQTAVRGDATAMRYLAAGDPEVTMRWMTGTRVCKGRADWITRVDGDTDVLFGLKTARDCRPFPFGSQAAKLGYHLQWAFYFDGYVACTGREPKVVETVVESDAPHSVVTYVIPSDIIEQGREEYRDLLTRLAQCEAANDWPGPATEEQVLTLPSWVYDAADDLSDLGLVAE